MNKESSDYRLKAVQNDIALNVIQLFFQYQNDKAWFGVLKTQLDGVEEQIKRTEKEVEIGNRPKKRYLRYKKQIWELCRSNGYLPKIKKKFPKTIFLKCTSHYPQII